MSSKAKAQAYRQSDKGRMARKMYLNKPEVKLRMKIRRAMKSKMSHH